MFNKEMEYYLLNANEILFNLVKELFIIDIGVISKIYDDKKHIDVKHLIKPVMHVTENNKFYEMPVVETENVELLFLGSSCFRIEWELKEGDLVLLLGTKNYIDNLENTEIRKSSNFLHYQQENLKALPIFSKADVYNIIKITSDKILLDAGDNEIEIKSNKLNINTNNIEIKVDDNLISSDDNLLLGKKSKNNFDILLNSLKTHTHSYSGGNTGIPNEGASWNNPLEVTEKVVIKKKI